MVRERIRRCPVCDRPIFNNALADHEAGCGWPGTMSAHMEALNDAFSDLAAGAAWPVVWLVGHPRLFGAVYLACVLILAAFVAALFLGLIPATCPNGGHAVGLLCLGQ